MVTNAALGTLAVRPVGLALNAPIDARLDQLWAIARSAGQPTSRQEIIAALILDASPQAASLIQLLTRYRSTTVDEVMVAGAPPFVVGPKRPGRRRLREAVDRRGGTPRG